VERDQWSLFWGRFQLRGDIYGQGGRVELTDGYIKHAAIKRTMVGRIDHTTTNQKSASDGAIAMRATTPAVLLGGEGGGGHRSAEVVLPGQEGSGVRL